MNLNLFHVIFAVLVVIFITMDTTTSIKPKKMEELMSGLSGFLSKHSNHNIQTLTAKKQPRQAIAQSRSAEKMIKPLTIAEMRAEILALKVQNPRRAAKAATTTKKRTWNSSVKVDSKIVSRTAYGQMNNNPVRKVLNFQSKPKAVSNLRAAMAQDSPKFPKPELRAKKSLYLQGCNNVRISGISNIAETPLVNIPKRTQRSQMALANKENLPNINIKKTAPPKMPYHNKLIIAAPDSPLSNESWKSNCDASFLQKEKEINDEKLKELAEEKALENITEFTPPASTPFKEYRSVQQFFHNSIDAGDSTMYHDNTIMCFDNHADYQDNAREESVIVSLCDLLNKASVNNSLNKNNTQQNQSSQKIRPPSELDQLLQLVNNSEQYIILLETSIATFNKMKELELTNLKCLKRMVKDKSKTANAAEHVKPKNDLNSKSKQTRENSVIKSAVKSPSYKVPKRNSCLRKKMFCKSMPNVSNNGKTHIKTDTGNRAINMYMRMKEHMSFLSTPVSTRSLDVLDTPAVTSNNLQKQLDKLYEN